MTSGDCENFHTFMCPQPGCVNTTEMDIRKCRRMKNPHRVKKVTSSKVFDVRYYSHSYLEWKYFVYSSLLLFGSFVQLECEQTMDSPLGIR